MKWISLFLYVSVATAATAQTAVNQFPAEATVFSAQELQSSLEGKVYTVDLPNGDGWRFEFKAGGAYSFKTNRSAESNRKWSVQDSKLCTEGARLVSSCNEVRKMGDVILLKRDSGEIVKMNVQ